MTDRNRAKARILDYWRAVELFSPQSVPRVNVQDEHEPVFNLTKDTIPPWHPKHPLQRKPLPNHLTWRHQVFCGIFDIGGIVHLLEEKVGRDKNSTGEYPKQESAVCSFTVSNGGQPYEKSLVISTSPWAAARTFNPGPSHPNWLSGFDECAEKIRRHFPITSPSNEDNPSPDTDVEDSLETPPGNKPWIMTSEDVHREASRIVIQLGAHAFIPNLMILVKSYRVSRRREEVLDDADILNSFFYHDLERVSKAIIAGNFGQGLSSLLDENINEQMSRRIDVRENPDVVYQMLSPARYPEGRWPSMGKSPLFLSQQLAVNHITARLNSRAGLSSVNGPPGTGKTTLIRELIAFVVVERAKRLANLIDHSQAFTERGATWVSDGYTRSVAFLNESITGFEVVIASNNNGAVENVVLEIPGINAVDPSYSGEDTYFAAFAERLLGAPAWGLLATRLGNRNNRNLFANKFWFSTRSRSKEGEEQSYISFLDYLNNRSEGSLEWGVAVKRFNQVLEKEAQQRNRRLEVYNLPKEIPIIRQQVADIARTLDEALKGQTSIRHEEKVAEEATHQTLTELNAAVEERLLHQQFRPSLLQIIFSLGKDLKRWQQRDLDIEQRIEDLRNEHRQQSDVFKEIKERLSKVDLDIEQLRKRLTAVEGTLETKLTLVEEAEQWLGQHLLKPEMLDDLQLREKVQPWLDPEWNETRAEVFLEALRLHKLFIQCNARKIRNNLSATMDIISGKAPRELPSEVARHAWSTLFLVIPVLSTTFASLDRLFSHLDREQLGWLIIDEAGQATPQSAVGAIWRAKRTVALGDPLQLEPVVTLPMSVQEALQKHYDVEKQWIPGNSSLQRLIDEVNPVGSFVELREGMMWVGSPLRVHRRCDRPMFDISNKVAYSNQMVFDTPKRNSVDLLPSKWIDIVGKADGDHWIPKEGMVANKLVSELLSNDKNLDRILVLAPFRAVARPLYIQMKTHEKVDAGTIHIAQGKEADVVILVLGGNPERPGAFRWASAKPNLLNVAVSRAKRRLYVVGNKELWAKFPYFRELATILDDYQL